MLAALIASAAPLPIPKSTDSGHPQSAEVQGNAQSDGGAQDSKTNVRLPGAAPTSPVYVKAACEHGCGYSEIHDGFWVRLWTDPVATFSLFLVLVNVPLAVGTIIAARAARKAAEALPTLERAYIFVIREHTLALWDALRGKQPFITINQYLVNVGRTPAIIKSAKTAIIVCSVPEEIEAQAQEMAHSEWIISPNTNGAPPEDEYDRRLRAIHHWQDWVKQTATNVRDDPADVTHLTEEEWLSIRSGDKFLWAWCKIIYDDVFGTEHITTYLLRASADHRSAEPYGGNEWNYRT